MNGHSAHGEPRVVALGNAAGNVGVDYQLGGDYRYRIVGLCLELVTAGGGGARRVIAKLLDSTGALVFGVAAPGTHGGGLTCVYSFADGLTATGTVSDGFQTAPFVGGDLPENLSVAVEILNGAAGDSISDGRLLVVQRRREPEPG